LEGREGGKKDLDREREKRGGKSKGHPPFRGNEEEATQGPLGPLVKIEKRTEGGRRTSRRNSQVVTDVQSCIFSKLE